MTKTLLSKGFRSVYLISWFHFCKQSQFQWGGMKIFRNLTPCRLRRNGKLCKLIRISSDPVSPSRKRKILMFFCHRFTKPNTWRGCSYEWDPLCIKMSYIPCMSHTHTQDYFFNLDFHPYVIIYVLKVNYRSRPLNQLPIMSLMSFLLWNPVERVAKLGEKKKITFSSLSKYLFSTLIISNE
jgi:hypothetical protein